MTPESQGYPWVSSKILVHLVEPFGQPCKHINERIYYNCTTTFFTVFHFKNVFYYLESKNTKITECVHLKVYLYLCLISKKPNILNFNSPPPPLHRCSYWVRGNFFVALCTHLAPSSTPRIISVCALEKSRVKISVNKHSTYASMLMMKLLLVLMLLLRLVLMLLLRLVLLILFLVFHLRLMLYQKNIVISQNLWRGHFSHWSFVNIKKLKFVMVLQHRRKGKQWT